VVGRARPCGLSERHEAVSFTEISACFRSVGHDAEGRGQHLGRDTGAEAVDGLLADALAGCQDGDTGWIGADHLAVTHPSAGLPAPVRRDRRRGESFGLT